MSKEVLDKILENKIIAIIRGVSGLGIVKLAQALSEGGVCCIENTFDQSESDNIGEISSNISQIRDTFGDKIVVGAGTVMSVEQVKIAASAGAQYIVSPNVNEEVIRATKELGLISIPGAMTPTEISQAYSFGADIVKLFPAGLLGPAYVKALKAPLKNIPIAVFGGITVDNCSEYIKAGAVCIGLGSNLINMNSVNEGRFAEITSKAEAFVNALKKG